MRTLFRAAALAAALCTAALAQPIQRPSYAYLPSARVVVGTSATALATRAQHNFIAIWNNDAALTLYVAFDSAVTTTSGVPIPPGQYLFFNDVGAGQLLYGVTTSGTLDARVQEGFSR